MLHATVCLCLYLCLCLVQCLYRTFSGRDICLTGLDLAPVHLDHARSAITLIAIVRDLDTRRAGNLLQSLSYHSLDRLAVDRDGLIVLRALSRQCAIVGI